MLALRLVPIFFGDDFCGIGGQILLICSIMGGFARWQAQLFRDAGVCADFRYGARGGQV